MDKLITRGLLVAAIALGGLAVAGTATAAPNPDDATHAGPHPDDPDGPELAGTYPSYATCATAGDLGAQQDLYKEWHCVHKGGGYQLWVVFNPLPPGDLIGDARGRGVPAVPR